MIILVKCNILHMDFNDDCYGIVNFYQIVMNVNVNFLNDKMNKLNVFITVCCIIVSIMNEYQIKLNEFTSIIDHNAAIIKLNQKNFQLVVVMEIKYKYVCINWCGLICYSMLYLIFLIQAN